MESAVIYDLIIMYDLNRLLPKFSPLGRIGRKSKSQFLVKTRESGSNH